MSILNSIDSLNATQRSGLQGERHEAILAALTKARRPVTDRELCTHLGYADMNAVRPRINELLAACRIRLGENRICKTTGRKVRTVSLAQSDDGYDFGF